MLQDYSRLCVGCRQLRPVSGLVRIVKVHDSLFLELPGTLSRRPGRGVYLCFNRQCLTPALKKKGKRPPLAYHLRTVLSEAFINELNEAFHSAPSERL